MRDANTPTQETVDRRLPTRPREEIARLGKEIYERDIRSQVEGAHVGEVVAIDVESGGWAIDYEVLEAVDRLRTKLPEAINVFCERVGYRALDSFGGGSIRRAEVHQNIRR